MKSYSQKNVHIAWKKIIMVERDKHITDWEIFPFEHKKKDSKVDGLRWDLSPMMLEKYRQKAQSNPSFYRVFDSAYNLTQAFKSEIKYRTTGERNIIIEVTGMTGSGKSLVAITIALEWMAKPIDADDICFTTDELLKRAMEIGKNHSLIQDEQINQLGAGSQRENFERQTLEDTTRKFGLNILFCSPTTREHTTAHYNTEVICINKKKRISKVAIIGSGGQYMGYFVIKVLPEKHKLWKAYNKKKDLFIKDILSRSTQRLSLDNMSDAVKKNKMYVYAKTREEMKIVATKTFPTLTIQEISMIVDNIRMMDRMREVMGDTT